MCSHSLAIVVLFSSSISVGALCSLCRWSPFISSGSFHLPITIYKYMYMYFIYFFYLVILFAYFNYDCHHHYCNLYLRYFYMYVYFYPLQGYLSVVRHLLASGFLINAGWFLHAAMTSSMSPCDHSPAPCMAFFLPLC